jgi:hypothetical protein
LVHAALGRLWADKLTRFAVQRMVDAIAQGKTAGTFKTKARGKAGGTGTAARVVELLGSIWAWAERRDDENRPLHPSRRQNGS